MFLTVIAEVEGVREALGARDLFNNEAQLLQLWNSPLALAGAANRDLLRSLCPIRVSQPRNHGRWLDSQ